MTTITISATITSSVIKGGASAQPPVNTIAPVVSGSTSIGSVLSCTTGTWTGTPPITYAYQWVRGVSDILGATSPTYTLVEADAGNNILCQVTATNIAGSSSVSSNALAIPLLLDSYPNAAVAYSVRKLRTAYSGAALRVRRSSDNAESDIGFVSNQLDTASLLSFVGAGNGFVTTWYDQSGNAQNLTQTTAANQPRIVNAGVLETISGKASMQFDGSNDAMYVNFPNIVQPNYYSIVTTKPNSGYRFVFDSSSGGRQFLANSASDTSFDFNAGTTISGGNTLTAGTRYLINLLANSTNSYVYTNNNLYVNANAGTNGIVDLALGYWITSPNTNNANIKIQEFIIYPSDQSANRIAINTNTNSYYTVWSSGPTWDGSQSGMLNTYSGAAVAYSVRALNSAYTGPLIRVRRSSDNAEINIFALYNGELDTTFLLNFVGANNGFVTTWYDQSGNGNNATQVTAASQFRIVNAGVIYSINGKPHLYTNNNQLMLSNAFLNPDINNGSTIFNVYQHVFQLSSSFNVNCIYSIGNGSTNTQRLSQLSVTGALNNPIDYVAAAQGTNSVLSKAFTSGHKLFTQLIKNNNNKIFINSNLENFDSNTLLTFTNTPYVVCLNRFQFATHGFSNSYIAEFIVYNNDQSANISAINTNINSYFNIYP